MCFCPMDKLCQRLELFFYLSWTIRHRFWHTLPLRWLCCYYRHSDLQDTVKTQWPMNSEKTCSTTAVKVTYSTGHGHCSITRVFHAWKSPILHANSMRKRRVKHLCKNLHAKIHVLSAYLI